MNRKIWLISPFGRDKSLSKSYSISGSKSFEDVWTYDLSNNCIALGSSYASNPKGKSVNQIKFEILKNNKESYSERTCTMKAKQLWSLYNEIKEGDIIIAKDGLKTIRGFGKVFSKDGSIAFYSEEKGYERTNNSYNPHPNFLYVDWKEERIDFGVPVFVLGRFLELNKALQIKYRSKYMELINKRIADLWGDEKLGNKKIVTKKDTDIIDKGSKLQGRNLNIDDMNKLIAEIRKLKNDPEHRERAHESLVETFYTILGYEKFSEIKHRQGRIDISITVDNKVRIINEVKRSWGLSSQDDSVLKQAFHYANESGSRYVVITNGDYYAVFDRTKGLSYGENFLGEFQLSQLTDKNLPIIDIIKKDRLGLA